VMTITDSRSVSPLATLRRGDWFSFLVPVVRPTGSTSRVILWGHLWFLTSFLWVIVASPLLFWIYRKVGAWSLLIHLSAFAIVVFAQKKGLFSVRSEYIDIAMFGWFFQLGFLYDDGTLQRLKPRVHLASGMALLAMGWLVAERIEPVWKKFDGAKQINELYASATGHFLVGAGWMFLAFAARQPISNWLNSRKIRAVDFVTQRTYTLFIWGPAANAVAMAASRKVGGSNGNILVYLTVTAITLIVLTILFGWIEDWASSRKPRLLPALA
jgi:peptidoglycan/LPS O-acetylase OafA/YrhL